MNIWPELQCKTSQFSLFIFFEISKSKPLAICFVIRFSNVSLFKGVEERSTFLKLARWIHLWRQSSTAAFENPGGQHKQKFVSLLSSPHIFFFKSVATKHVDRSKLAMKTSGLILRFYQLLGPRTQIVKSNSSMRDWENGSVWQNFIS